MIYADNAATTKMSDAAVKTLTSLLADTYGNPSSLYEFGQKAKEVLAGIGVTDFDSAEVTFLPNEYVDLSPEDAQKIKDMLAMLDECEDVQNVYHNVNNI